MDCLAWGVLKGRRCSSCCVWRHNYPGEHECAGCGRILALNNRYCRLCWQQARIEAKTAGELPRGAVSVLETGNRLRGHQLFFDRMKLRRPEPPPRRYGRRRGAPPKPPPVPVGRPAPGPVQLTLFDARRDFTRFNEAERADPDNPWLRWAIYLAHRLGEARGWGRGIRFAVRRGLVILLSQHADGDVVRYTEMVPALRRLGISSERVADVLTEMGILVDDRRSSFEDWLERKLDGLASGIRRDVETWQRTLRDGGPRTRPRTIGTVWNHMNNARPVLLEWSVRYDHLREVTRDDVLAALEGLHGVRRGNTLVALRSLFAFCKKIGTIFRNPASRIKVGQHAYGVLQPLSPDDVDQAVAVATTPASRLILALAAVHAARSKEIRELRLDDVELGDRKLVVAGRVRPLDDLTHRLLRDWLDYRRGRWPNTANPHLIINQHTATETGPVSTLWPIGKIALRGHTATLERLRVDRQLEEALTHGPDPLHLAAVFGLDEKTAIRYAASARQLLETEIECDTAG